jgi:hypothetical protein
LSRLVPICLLCSSAACLPLGDGPEGQHLIHDRTLSQAFFIRPAAEPATSYLFVTGAMRSISVGEGTWFGAHDLYEVDSHDADAAVTGLEQRQPAVSGVPETMTWDGAASLTLDSRGRLVVSSYDLFPPWQRLVRFDPRSGVAEPLADLDPLLIPQLLVSPGRTRIFLDTVDSQMLIELDGQRELANATSPIFLGEDVYYVEGPNPGAPASGGESRLMRIRPDSEPEVLGAWQEGMRIIGTVQGALPAQLLIGFSNHFVLLDPATLATTDLPSELVQARLDSASSSGRWLLFQSFSFSVGYLWQAYDRTTGEVRTLDAGLPAAASPFSAMWRPGRDEVWFQTQDGFATWNLSDGRIAAHQMLLGSCQKPDSPSFSPFNRDGSRWFSQGTEGREIGSPTHMGWADDPDGPTIPINPEGTWVKYCWELEDNRFLVSSWTDNVNQTDLYLVDATTGSMRALAGGASMVTAGRSRILALADWESWRSAGTLTLIDIATGARTSLAGDVAFAAVNVLADADVVGGSDPLAPGSEVAFMSRYRLDSPYDGLWVTTLP